jgi:hypothetical protein
MTRERSWYTGLTCRRCGRRVVGKDSGFFCQPVGQRGRLLQGWAEHGSCREVGKR